MSDHPQPPKGPRETRIAFLWHEAWNRLSEGQIHQFFPAQAAAELAVFRSQLAPDDVAGRADLTASDILDRSNRESMAAHEARLANYRATMASLLDFAMNNVSKAGLFVAQALTYANGAVALATLGYIGRDAAGPPSGGMIAVLVFSSVGFLLMLLSGHVATLTAQPFLKLLAELSAPLISDKDRQQKAAEFPTAVKKATLPTRCISYLSVACLIVALIVGTCSLISNAST